MKATILQSNNGYKIITARNIKSLSNKLANLKIVISEIDLLFMSMTAGYTQVNDSIKISIETK